MNKSNFKSDRQISKQTILNNNLELIPISEINIIKDSSKTVGYDFTIEDNYTFSTHDGIMLMDCMAVYFLSTKESIDETNEKIGIWANLISPSDNTIVPRPNQDIILGIYTATK